MKRALVLPQRWWTNRHPLTDWRSFKLCPSYTLRKRLQRRMGKSFEDSVKDESVPVHESVIGASAFRYAGLAEGCHPVVARQCGLKDR